MRVLLKAGAAGVIGAMGATPASATEVEINIEIPRLQVAEYHRPYVAVWVERADQSVAGNLAVWYDIANAKKEGVKWLKDLRQWWRKIGRDTNVQADGVSGATRPAGKHALKFDSKHKLLSTLAPGEYQIVVEAAREVGGRELVRLPLKLPASAPVQNEAKGKDELGAVSLSVKP